MNKTELTKVASERFEVSQVKAKEMVETFESIIVEGLTTDGEVVFMDSKFKTVHVDAKPEKQGRNPQSGEPMTIPAKEATTKVVFKVGKKLKEMFK